MRFRVLILIAALVWLTEASASPPKPLLWQVSDADNSVYLLGSFHMLKAEDYPLAAAANRAFDDADRIYFEVSPIELHDEELISSVMTAGFLADGQTLKKSLKPAIWRRLVRYCKTNGFPVESLQAMKPWLAALTVSNLEIAKAGYLPDLGMDEHYMEMATIAGKKTLGLETLREQIGVFDQLTPDEQGAFLQQTLEDMQSPEQLEDLHRHWRNGDADGLLRLLSHDRVKDLPTFFRRLNSDRNRAWLPQIAAFLRDNKTGSALAVVGSLHLLGSDGLVELLKGQGFQVKRLH